MANYNSKHTGLQIDDAIARALPGGAIDLEKAPAGYGLGGSAKYLTADDDLNNIWQAGWYAWDAPPKNVPAIPAIGLNGSYCSMLVMNKGGSYTFAQIVVTIDGFVFFRNVVGGASDEWDILNPPMNVGVEFRTTERLSGSPVYAQLFDCSPLPNATTKVFPVEGAYADNVSVVVDYGGMSTYFGQSLQNKGFASLNVTQRQISITTEADLSAGNAYVWVKYTKSV